MEYNLQQVYELAEKFTGNYLIFQSDGAKLKYLHHTSKVGVIIGYSDEELQQLKAPFELVFEEDRMLIIQLFSSVEHLEERVNRDALFRIKHKTKGFIWIHMSVSEFGEVEGKMIWLVNLTDVSHETEISYALMESSERYICVIERRSKRILYANSIFYDLIDSNPAEAMGKHCYELLCKTLSMKDNDNCLCYSSLNAEPIETYNEKKDKFLTITGREVVWGEYDAYVFYLTDITEKKRQEEELLASQRRFEMALDNSDLMVWEYDIVNSRCIISQKASNGYALPTVIENYPESLFATGYTPPETVEQIKEVQRRLLNGETGFSVERRTINKEGVSEWQKVEYTLECDEKGKPIRAIVCGLDITRQKELEQKYAEQVEYRNKFTRDSMFSMRLDMTSDGVIDYTCTNEYIGKILYKVKSAAAAVDGFFRDLDLPEENEIAELEFSLEALNKAYELGQSQYKIADCWSRRMERFITINLYLDRNPASKHMELFFIVTDVTENVLKRKALESVASNDYDFVALVNTKNGKATMMAMSEKSIFPEQVRNSEFDYNSVVVDFAKAHRSLYLSDEDFRSVTDGIQLPVIIEKLSEQEAYDFTCKTMLEGCGVTTFRMRFSYMDESKKYIIYSRTNITKAVQEELAIQRKLEAALQAAEEASRAKTDFLARMSHDIRTPMNAIIGLTALSLDEKDVSDQLQENLTNIRSSGDFLLGLVNDILDMSKIESGAVKLKNEPYYYMDFLAKLKAMFEPMCEAKNITFDFEDVTIATCIQTDVLRLDQIFFNILSNAVKYTPEGGRIAYYTRNVVMDEQSISGDYIIEDNGIGMSEQFLGKLFDPFEQEDTEYSAKLKGSGLGLAIAKSLTELMGGSITVESRENVGTKVILHLHFLLCPNRDKGIMGKEDNSADREAILYGKRVLLVEDHPLNARIAQKLLEKRHMNVVHAENGKVAVEYFNMSKPHFYDAILMDIRMPVMDGLESAARIRSLHREDAKAYRSSQCPPMPMRMTCRKVWMPE